MYCDLCGRWDENDHDKCEAHITQLKKVIQTGWTAEMKKVAAEWRASRDPPIVPPASPGPVTPSDSSSDDSEPAHNAAAARRRELDRVEREVDAEKERKLALARQEAMSAQMAAASGSPAAEPAPALPPPSSRRRWPHHPE